MVTTRQLQLGLMNTDILLYSGWGQVSPRQKS